MVALENFHFSIMYELPEEREVEEFKMKKYTQQLAGTMINKGLANDAEAWIQGYL